MNRRDEISEIILLGLSYKTAPLEIREKFTFDDDALKKFHEKAKSGGIGEIVYLATCNRVEIYFTAQEIHRSIDRLMDILEEFTGLSRENFSQYIYMKYSRDVVLHLLTVASSLDSMVIGENEILGQLKQAYRDSVLHKNSGILLNRLFHQSFNTAKKVRTETGISQNPLSIAFIAVEKAREMFNGDLTQRSALLIGAGEMGELILKYLTKNSIKEITIANRSIPNAETIVERINKEAHIIPLSDISAVASQVDIIITSVTCHDYLLSYPLMRTMMEKRADRPIFMIDIAVPRNIDPAVAAIDNVILYNIDDLKSIADENLKSRLMEVEAAMQIVHSDADEMIEWYEGLEMVPMIVHIQESFDKIREQELLKCRRRQLKHLSDEEFQHIDDLTRQIISKILHNPIMMIKKNKALHVEGYQEKRGDKAEDQDYRGSFQDMKQDHVPRLIFWELTKECNLNCIHCRAEAESSSFEGELSLADVLRVIDEISSHYKPILVLTGGEPLYRKDIFEIAACAKSAGLTTALATNGTLIDGTIAGKIRDSGIRRVSISIDGSTAAAHDSFRGIPGSYDRALEGIRHLVDAGVEFQINTTVSRRNVDDIENVLKLAGDTGAKALHLFMLVPVGCGVEIAEAEMISKEKYESVLNWFYDKSRESALELKATCAPHYYRIIRQRAHEEGRALTFEQDGLAAVTRGCLAGTGVCFISHRGDVQPCGYLPLVAGNVLKQPFHEIWEDAALLRSLRDLDNLTGKCGICEYRASCAGCRARAYYDTGDYLSGEPYCAYIPPRAKSR